MLVSNWTEEGLGFELTKDRAGQCLFFKRVAKMSFETAKELERRAANRREAEKDRNQTRWAFRISIGALIVSIAVSGITLLRGCEPAQMEVVAPVPVQIAPTTQPADDGD